MCDDYKAAEILFASDIDNADQAAGMTVLTGMGSDPELTVIFPRLQGSAHFLVRDRTLINEAQYLIVETVDTLTQLA